MPGFYTKDGKVRPITPPKKGGGATAVAVAMAATIGIAAVGGGGGVGAAGALGGGSEAVAGSADSAAARTAARDLRVRTTKGRQAAQRGRQQEAWRRMRLKQLRRVVRKEAQGARCALLSYGQVRTFFQHTRCRSLRRALVVLGDGHGGTMVVAVAWVRMRRWADARRFRLLDDTDGTGNVTPIADAVLRANGVRFTGTHYASRPAGSLVVVAEAEPLTGHPSPDLLDAVAEVAREFPPP